MQQLTQILEALLQGMPPAARANVEQEMQLSTSGMRWFPNAGPQTSAYESLADELFYGGEAGGGKSELGIGLALNCHRRSLILREFKDDARALGERLCEIVGSRIGWNEQISRWRSSTQVVDFDGLPNEKDKQRHKGKPHDLIVFDELPDFYESQYDFIVGWNRSTVPGQRCRILGAGNPPTRAKGLWIIEKWGPWLDPKHPRPAKDGELRWFLKDADGREIEVEDAGPHDVGGRPTMARSRTFIRARLGDNPDLARNNYGATLDALPKELRDAYRDGRFDASLKDHPFQLIPTTWVQEAQKRWTPTPPLGIPMCAVGVDPMGGGADELAIAPRYDGWYAPIVTVPGKDCPLGRHQAGHVVMNRRDDADVVLDMGGGYGSGIYETLIQNGIRVQVYKGATGSTKRTKDRKLGFVNTRSATYWAFREALDPDQLGGSPIMLPPDPELTSDLTVVTFEVTGRGIQALPKDKVLEALGRSPNKGDAVVMAWICGARGLLPGTAYGREQYVGGARGRPFPRAADMGSRQRNRNRS